MKLIKLSLAVMLAMATASFGADSLEDAFKDGKFKGQFKFVYTNGSDSNAVALANDPAEGANTGSIAVDMRYLTGDYYGFKLGLGFEAAHDLEFHNEDGGSEDDTRNTVSAAHLHEAFLQYSFLKSNIKVGRQTIKLPMTLTSSAFALEDSFDAAVLTINEIPSTMLKLLYIKEWNMRYGDGSASTGLTSSDKHFSDAVYSLFFRNTSVKDLTLTGQYLTTDDENMKGDAPTTVTTGAYDEYYVKANYKLPTDFPMTVGAMYGAADFDATAVKSTDFYALLAGTVVSGVKLDAAYASVDEDNNFPGTLGHVPDAIIPTSMLTTNGIFAGMDSYSLQGIYNFGVKALSTRVKVAHFDQANNGAFDDTNEINMDIKYSFGGALKGLSTRLWAGYADMKDDDFTNLRFYAKYNF